MTAILIDLQAVRATITERRLPVVQRPTLSPQQLISQAADRYLVDKLRQWTESLDEVVQHRPLVSSDRARLLWALEASGVVQGPGS